MTEAYSLLKAPAHQATTDDRWIDVTTAAQLIGKDVSNIRRKAAELLAGQGLARLNTWTTGRKPFWEINSAADPKLTPGAVIQVGPPVEQMKKYPAELIAQANVRKAILDRWEKALAAGVIMGITRDAATDAFIRLLAKEGTILKRRRLYDWNADFKAEGLVGLMDGRARHIVEEKMATASKGGDPFLESVKDYWLCQQKPGIAVCHKMALLEAHRNGWTPCSYRSAARFIEQFAKDNAAIVAQMRGGDEFFKNEVARHIERDYSTLRSNEFWNADHHQFDVIVRVGTRLNSKTGEFEPIYARPWLTAWQDYRSRKIVGWIIRANAPDTTAILEALRFACRSHGVPESVYTDNGKDYDAKALTGETKDERRKRRKLRIEHDQVKLGGVYAALQIEHHRTWKYHGQSKPIERFFGTVEGQFGKTFDTYCGNNPQNRPEQLDDMLARGRAPSLEEFIRQFATWIEVGYNQSNHTGDAMDCKPSEAWEANLQTKRTAEDELLELLMQPRIGPLHVGQNGVVYKGIWYGQYDLASFYGQKVFITFEAGINRVNVWSEDGRFLCIAKANLRIAANATPEQLKEVIAEQRRENKVLREAARIRPRIHRDRTDRLNEAAALAAQRQAAVMQPDPTPPSIAPIRSDLEDQLPAIRQGFALPLKKAVGDDTPIPNNFTYSSKQSTEDHDSPRTGFIYHAPTGGQS